MSSRRSPRPAKVFVPEMTGIRQNDVFASRPRSILASWRQRRLVSLAACRLRSTSRASVPAAPTVST